MKLKKLKDSFNVTLANEDGQGKNTSRTNSLASDDEQAKTAHKPKQKRKWIKKSKYQNLQKKKKKEKISVVFNYSRIELTNAMERVLNKGLNFAIMPLNLNLSRISKA